MQNQATASELRELPARQAVSAGTNGEQQAAREVPLVNRDLPPAVLERRLRQCERVIGYSRLKAARYLLEFDERELWRRLGFSSTVHYASVVLGLCRREVWGRLRVARGLRVLPILKEAVESGRISWSKARELVRVVTPEDEAKWVAWAEGVSYRQVEGRVGESVADEGGEECLGMSVKIPRAGKVRVTVELTTGEFALLDQAMRAAREETKSERVAEQLVHVAKCYLAGGGREGRKKRLPVRMVVHRCFECGRVWQETSKGRVAVALPEEIDEVVDLRKETGEAVGGDADGAGSVSGEDMVSTGSETPPSPGGYPANGVDLAKDSSRAGTAASSTWPGSRLSHNDQQAARDHTSDNAELPGLRQAGSDSSGEMVNVGGEAIPSSGGYPASVVDQAKDSSRAGTGARERSRWIPSGTRQVVKDRDGGRCQVEGCENWKWTEVHHVKLFSKGGKHQLGNLLTLCSEHHRQLHEGTLELLKDPARILGFK